MDVNELFGYAINIIILISLLVIFIGVFFDSRKLGISTVSAVGWAAIASLFFPPFGFVVYIFYRNKKWL